jgi:hypothetical protein
MVITSVRDMMKVPPSFDGVKGYRRAVAQAVASAIGAKWRCGSTLRVTLNQQSHK